MRASHLRPASLFGGITQFEFSFPRSHAQTAACPLRALAASRASAEASYSSLSIDGAPVELVDVDPFVPQLREFSEAIEQGRNSSPDAHDGLAVLKVIEARHLSSRERRAIPL